MVNLLLALIYIAFVSLGLPDSLLGSAWPSMYTGLGVPLSYAGVVSALIALCTILSSLQSDRLTQKLGTGKLTMFSAALTAVALIGFSTARSFAALCLWAVPYGLGAGSVDAALNNYVALHYASKHMNWLHCMWGVGAMLGPCVMSYALSGGYGWELGYRSVGMLQVVLTAILFFSLPLWKGRATAQAAAPSANKGVLSLRAIAAIPGAKNVMLCLFCYCALEQTTGLWASTYLMLVKGVSAEDAAGFAALFFIGITAGRAISGFIAMKCSDEQMVRMGQGMVLLGVLMLLLPLPMFCSLLALVLVGLGCAPIYPCLLHATPAHFGADRSQALIGVQMASAYIGACLMPPLFGAIAGRISAALLPPYLLTLLAVMTLMHERLIRKVSTQKQLKGMVSQ